MQNFCRFLMLSAVLGTLLAAPNTAAQTKVDVIKAKRQHSIQALSVPATVNARNISDISFGTSGRLQQFQLDVGAQVRAGDVLARLDRRQINAAIKSLEAQRDAAEATVADEQQQVAELESLAETQFVAQSELRRARAALAVARANLAEYQALLNEREVERDYHQLRAPFSGVVAERHIDQGEWVNQDQVAFRLVETGEVYVDAYLAQRYLEQIDDSTEVAVRYGSDQRMAATIATKVPYLSDNARTFLLRLTPERTEPLTVGAAVTADVAIRSKNLHLTVPQDAVIRYSDGRTSVWIARRENQQWLAREQLVELGERFNGWVVVRADRLSADTRVVVRGNESLTDGEVLQLTESNDYD